MRSDMAEPHKPTFPQLMLPSTKELFTISENVKLILDHLANRKPISRITLKRRSEPISYDIEIPHENPDEAKKTAVRIEKELLALYPQGARKSNAAGFYKLASKIRGEGHE